jgi:asparagine synthase (glutamine-hydrolysing)
MLEGYLLHTQGDRMLMGHGVEGRFPYLDHRVVDFAGRLPDRVKLRGLHEKHLLRRAAEPLLPQAITTRRKHPYRAPIASALLGPRGPEYVGDLLSPRAIADAGIFSAPEVGDLRRKLERGGSVGETDEMALVGVVSTMLLHRRFVAEPRLPSTTTPTRVVIGSDVAPPPTSSTTVVGSVHGGG